MSLDDIFNIKNEICDSIDSDYADCAGCPFNNFCSVLDYVLDYRDRIKTICTEWEMNKPTITDKINEILKPYGMKLFDNSSQIWIDDNDLHKPEEVINKLKTKWKGKLNE